jgi:hypothetical protein
VPARLALAALLLAAALAVPAAALRSGEGNPDTVLANLKKMDTELDTLLAMKTAELKGDAVGAKLRELLSLKRAALEAFPDIWGIKFLTVYDKLEEIDDMLANKPPLVGMAWRASDELEKELRDNGKGVPKAASQGVYELTQELSKLLGEYRRGDFKNNEEEFVKRAREIAAKKRTLLTSAFPQLFGHGFWKWFSPLEDIDFALEQAKIADAGDRRKLLERVKKLKEPLLGLLAVQPAKCPPGKSPRSLAKQGKCEPRVSRIKVTFVVPVSTYTVKATDPQSKGLSYSWHKVQKKPCGVFTWTGPKATWSHPDATLGGDCPNENFHPALVYVDVSNGQYTCRASWPYGSAPTIALREAGLPAAKRGVCKRT